MHTVMKDTIDTCESISVRSLTKLGFRCSEVIYTFFLSKLGPIHNVVIRWGKLDLKPLLFYRHESGCPKKRKTERSEAFNVHSRSE